MPEPMRLAFVEWEDSCGTTPTWTRLDEIYTETGVFWSVGWVLDDDETRIVLVPHMTRPTEEVILHGCGDMVIPRSAIRQIEYIDDPRAEPDA